MVKKKFLFFLAAICIYCCCRSATRTSAGSGAWANGSTWSGGTVPTCGDSVIVQSGHTVTVTAMQNYMACSTRMALTLKGLLFLDPGKKLEFPCGSTVYLLSGGSIASGGSGGSDLDICGVTMYQGNTSGTVSSVGCFPPTAPNCSGVLPVELVSFDVTPCEDGVCISWTTQTEHNNNYYLLERAEDGLQFDAIGEIKTLAPNGNSKSKLEYFFRDTKPLPSVNYYRLKQVDQNLSYTYSSLVTLNIEKSENYFKLFPNPGPGAIHFKLLWKPRSGASVKIHNAFGHVIKQVNVTESEIVMLQLQDPGIYFCVVELGHAVFTEPEKPWWIWDYGG